jgi:hypothetical protein
MEGAAAPAGGADASSVMESTAAAKAARGMCSLIGRAALPSDASFGESRPGLAARCRGQASNGWQNGPR